MFLHVRAILVLPAPLERPIQTFHSDMESAREWARKILALDPEGSVKIYETTETLRETVTSPSAATPGRR